MPATGWASGVVVFLAVALGTVSLGLLWEWWLEQSRRRLIAKQLEALQREGATTLTPERTLVREIPAGHWLAPLAHLGPVMDLHALLEQAHIGLSLQTFLLLSVGLALGAGCMGYLASGTVIAGVLAGALFGMMPGLYAHRQRRRRMQLIEEQLPEAIDLLGRAIRAGHPLTAGFKMISDEAAPEVAEVFRRMFEEQRFGLPFDDTLYAMVDRVPLVDLRILVTAILLQREVGGNLAENLDNIAQTIRARFTIRRQIRVHTAQGRLSGYILALLPPVVGMAIFSLNPDYMLTLFHDPAGKVMLVTACLFQVLGYLWIRRIVNVEI